MRRALLWLASGAGVAAAVAPLPEIETGTWGKEVRIAETYWHPGSVATSDAFLVGTVKDTSSDIQTTAQQTWMSETCSLRVEQAFGVLTGIQGMSQALLTHEKEASPYVAVDPERGRLRGLKKGQKVLVLLHQYEGGPCFGSAGLIELTAPTRELPDILRRTAFQPSQFTEADLQVLKAAAPLLHADVADRRKTMRSAAEPEKPDHDRNLVLLVLGISAVILVSMWFGRRRLTR